MKILKSLLTNVPDKTRNVFWDVLVYVILLAMVIFTIFAELETLVKIIAFFLPIGIIVIMVVVLFQKLNNGKSEKTGDERDYIYNVPANKTWVLRNTFSSYPGSPLLGIYPGETLDKNQGETDEELKLRIKKERETRGYYAKAEGWSYRIPVLQEDMGVISLNPIEADIKAMEVNTKDSQTIRIDLQVTTQIKRSQDAIRFLISMEGKTVAEKKENRKRIEHDLLSTCANKVCINFISEDIQSKRFKVYEDDKDNHWLALKNIYEVKINKRERYQNPEHDEYITVQDPADPSKNLQLFRDSGAVVNFWEIITSKLHPSEEDDPNAPEPVQGEKKKQRKFVSVPIKLNLLIRNEMKRLYIPELYGIWIVQVGVQRVALEDVVSSSLQRERAAVIDRRAAKNESQAISEMIIETKANPTAVLVSQMVIDGLRAVFSKKKG